MQRLKCIVWCILFLGSCYPAAAQLLQPTERRYATILDLKSELLAYSEDYNAYMPYAQGTPFTGNAALFWLPLARYRTYQLQIAGPQATQLFINQNITANLAANREHYYALDSLYQIYGDSCLVAVYAPELKLEPLSLKIISTQVVTNSTLAGTENFLQVLGRFPRYFYNFFILAVLGVLAGLALLRNAFPRVFTSYYSLSDTLSARPLVNDAFSYKLSGTGQLGFLAVYCLLFGFLLITLFHLTGLEERIGWLVEDKTAGSYLWAWVRVSALVLVLQLLKYGLLQVVAGVFSINVASTHFFDYLRFSQIVISFLLAVVVTLVLGTPRWSVYGAEVLLDLVLLFALLRIGYLFYKLSAAGERRKTYLFSYLCTTEVLPLLVGLKLVAS